MKKKLFRILSVFLSAVLIFQTMSVGVYGANEVYFDMPKADSTIEEEYLREITVYSGTHSKAIGRAGTFSFNDFSLIPGLTFDVLSISSNIYPVGIKFNFNSSVNRFLKEVSGINSGAYGNGWLVNYGKFICETEYTDTREMYLFDGDGGCDIFVQFTGNMDEEPGAEQFPGRQKWISKYEYSDTVIWKLPERYIDYSTIATYVPEQYAVVDGSGEISRYDAFGRLIEKRSESGNSCLTVEYMPFSLNMPEAISKITDGMGNEFRFSYSGNKLTKIKAYTSDNTAIIAGDGEEAKPLEVNMSYSGDNLTQVTFPDEKSISFSYDNSGNLTDIVNTDNKKLEIEYTSGYISKVTEKAYDKTNETYISGNILTITRNSEFTRTFSDNYGSTEVKTFDETGKILTITDENGNILFDSSASPDIPEEDTTVPEETPEDEIISLCPCESCTEYICPCACETEESCTCIQCKREVYTEYDEFGNVTAEKAFDGTKTLVSEMSVYSDDGTALLSSTDSSGNTAYYTYDDSGFLKSVTAGTSSGIADYDAVGNLIAFSQSVTGLSDGNTMSNSYTYEDDKVKTISHNGFTYEFTYDAWGNQTKAKIGTRVLADNTYGTDENHDRLSSTTFANGQTISYAYDEDNNITAISYDGAERYEYEYDEDGAMQSVTDNASGIKTIITENGTQLRKASDDTILFSSSADENGNVTHNIADAGITYVYDGDYNSVTGVYTDTVAFENTGTMLSDGTEIDFSADANITTESDWFGRITDKSLDIDFTIDDEEFSLDSEINLTYADTQTTASTKITSFASTVTNGTNTVSQQEYYEYDSVGNITGIYRIEENEKVYYNKYYYDEANQLVREDNRLGDFTSTYTYDVGGNIVSRIRYPYTEGEITGLNATETHTYSYTDSTWGDILTAYNGQNVTYDAMGNITSLDGDTYTWTAGRQLSRITKADNTYIDYFYDDGGQISKLVMYNEEGVSEGGYEYFWEDTTLIGTKTLPGTTDTEEDMYFTRIIYDTEGEPLGFLLNDALPFLYTKNILGDITGVINYETSEYLFRYSYDAYGNYELIPTGDDAGSVLFATILSGLNPLSYRGYVFTPAIGISHYLGSRFYVPTLCRFMNADVYADTAQGVVGANMFAYCNNNPIAGIDPKGTNTVAQNLHQPLDVFSYLLAIYYAVCIFIMGTIPMDSISVSIPSFAQKTPIPSKLKNGNKVKTPDTHSDEFLRKGSEYRHKKTKWIFKISKDGHYGGKKSHWHAYPENSKTGDYYNIKLDGTIL